MSVAVWAGLADVADAEAADRLAASVESAGGVAVASARLPVLAAFARTEAATDWLEPVLSAEPGLRGGLVPGVEGDDPDTAESTLLALLETAAPGRMALAPGLSAPNSAAAATALAGAAGGAAPTRLTRPGPAAADPAPRPEPTDPGADLRPGHLLSHTYEIETLIARGGMGSVYLARHVDLGSQHAIKVISPEHARDEHVAGLFRREAESLRSIRHEAVIGHEGVIRDEHGRLYLVMEYADGPSLADVLRDEGRLAPEDVETLARRVGAGLEAAHAKGIIHRDISPDNIVLVGGDVSRALIIDFGIARNLETGRRTLIGSQFAGKYGYASPEQLGLFGGNVDRRSDLYSLGLVLAAALGRPIDLGRSPAEAARNREHPVDVSDFPPPWDRRLARLLAPDPADRPTRYAEVLAEAAPHPGSPPRRRGGAGRAVAALVLLAVIGGGLWTMRDSLLGPGGSGVAEGEEEETEEKPPGGPVEEAPVLPPLPQMRADLRAAIDAATADTGCHRLELRLSEGAEGVAVTLGGVAARESQVAAARAAARAQSHVTGVRSEVAVVPEPFCGFLALAGPGRRGEAPGLALNQPDAAYHDGERISLTVTARGDAPGHLHVSYIDRNGDLAHLLPNPVVRENRLEPGDSIALGEPRPDGDHRTYTAAEPHGANLVVAVSASEPLFETPRDEVERAGRYLTVLAAAIERVEAAGGRVSIAMRFLETMP